MLGLTLAMDKALAEVIMFINDKQGTNPVTQEGGSQGAG